MKPVTKALLLVGGRGTRVMPLTLHQPKGMIALADKPVVHYVIDELVSAGINEITIVHGQDQTVFKQYVDHLKKNDTWNNHIKFNFVAQLKPLGDGDAVLAAKKFIPKGEAFAVAFCDNVYAEKQPSLRQMIVHYQETKLPTILCVKMPANVISMYGVAKLGTEKIKNFFSITNFIEKPKLEEAPSNFVVLGRYVLPYIIFEYLEKLYDFKEDSEVRIANALKLFVDDHKKFWGFYNPKSLWFDCGSKEGLVQAQAYFALRHPHIKSRLKKILI